MKTKEEILEEVIREEYPDREKLHEEIESGLYRLALDAMERYAQEKVNFISLNIPVMRSVCISCDEEKETHEICIDCITKLINENRQTDA